MGKCNMFPHLKGVWQKSSLSLLLYMSHLCYSTRDTLSDMITNHILYDLYDVSPKIIFNLLTLGHVIH